MRHPLLTLAAVCALLSPLTLRAPEALAATTPAGAGSQASARVIVKFKADASVLRRQAQSATAATTAQVVADRAQALGQRTGLTLRSGAAVSERMQVMFASGLTSQQLAARLARESDVEFAVVDQRRRRFVAPNDPRYTAVGGNGPASGQWYLRAPSVTTPSGINAEGAWDVNPGSSSIVVAVLDTGVRFDHPDLIGKLRPGYDFIADVPTANDGDGRDADAADPGDWVTQQDIDAGPDFADCSVEDSSWHGTQVAGIIGANTNNGNGMASVGRNVMVLPVRVLGKCGGYDSDIIAGMRWAAGLNVPGVPANTTPARVLNLSLGGEGTCDASTGYPDAIAAINAAGAVIVASAGNSAGHAVSVPAVCSGVIGVSGLRHVGSKVGFSDLGPQITISAPGGNCVNTGVNDACLFPILTTTNAGTTTPVVGSVAFTDSFNISVGTSFSAPLVAGTAGLMLSANPALTPKQVELLLAATARPFPTTGGDNGDGTPVLECTAPQLDSGGSAVDQLQCYCSTGTCGAGMLDASAAVLAASNGTAPGVRARVDISPLQPVAQQVVQLRGTNSVLAAGRSIVSYQWALLDGGGIVSTISNPTQAVATATPSAAGRFKVRLTVIDNANATSTADLTMVVNAAPTPPPTPTPTPTPPPATGGGGGALGFGWLAGLLAAVWALRRTTRAAS